MKEITISFDEYLEIIQNEYNSNCKTYFTEDEEGNINQEFNIWQKEIHDETEFVYQRLKDKEKVSRYYYIIENSHQKDLFMKKLMTIKNLYFLDWDSDDGIIKIN